MPTTITTTARMRTPIRTVAPHTVTTHMVRAMLRPQQSSNGILGQTHRGEAESVAVYTRSGQLVGDADRHASLYNPPAP